MSIPRERKIAFVKDFLKNNEMKRRECVWILNYIINQEDLIDRVHFVEQGHYCDRAMVMSTTKVENIPFRFYKGSTMTKDAEKAFHDLRLNKEEELYIQLNFPEPFKSFLYLEVLEGNPFHEEEASEEDRAIAQEIIDESIKQFKIYTIEKQIDEAIDKKDKEKFLELSLMLAQS